MIDDSYVHDEEILEKINKNLYKRRFGISYSYKKGKSLDLKPLKNKKNRNLKKLNTSRESSKYNSLTNESSFHSKSIIHNLFNEVEKLELNKIYANFENESEDILPIQYFNKVNNCSVSKYGIKKSTDDIEYSYCKTCDHNLLKPICLCCINQCHKGHAIKYIFNKGRIKCCCGEKNHIGMKMKVETNNKNNDVNCLCNEWNVIAKLNFYYINQHNEPICILCHNYCQDYNKNDKIIKIEGNQTIPKCCCKNDEIHNDNRIIYEKIFSLVSSSKEFDLLLHPLQVVNMIFKSTNNFKMIFEYFEVFINNLNNSKYNSNIIAYFSKINSFDIIYTNIYKTLLLFEKIIKKMRLTNNMCYFNEKIINYFSFNTIKNLVMVLKESSVEEKIFWILSNKFLYLFHKIYINIKTQSLEKYKLNDLKNLSFCQRIIILKENKNRFKESEEIISFLLKFLDDIAYKGLSTMESIEVLKEIISIFRKFSCYNLMHTADMIKTCAKIYKCFNFLRIIRNFLNKISLNDKTSSDIKSKNDTHYFNKITLKVYYTIIKMFMNFIYNYNDNVINKIIYDKEKYPYVNSINLDNVCFIFKKNELGRFIFKITISILSIIQKNFVNYENSKIHLIQRIGMKILQYSLIKNDNYIVNIIGSLNKFKYYFEKNTKILKIYNTQYYKELNRQCILVSNAYYQYFNFEITILEMLEVVNDSLNFVLEDSLDYIDKMLSFTGNEIQKEFNYNQNISIISTNYFSLISKVINIIFNHQHRKNKFEIQTIDGQTSEYDDDERFHESDLNNFIQYIPMNVEDEIVKKILYFYFCFTLNSSDNSFLILTHYIFNELIKLPIKYCQLIFKLFYLCLKNVLTVDNSNIIIVEKSYIIKRLYNYLEKLIDEKNIKQNTLLFCIYYILEIIEITIFNSKSSFFNNFLHKIQNMIFTINKKYNLVQKYFDMKEKELGIQSNHFSNQSNLNILDLKKMTTVNESINLSKNKHSFGFDFYQRSILKKTFLIFIKLINDCFDFSIEIDRKRIEEMINVEKIIFALKKYKINLDLRTEFMRFLRKILLDLKYNINENTFYSAAIIKHRDSFKYIKNNNLINNMGYPTKLLSFLYDFYNITAKCSLKEKMEEKINKKNIFIKKNDDSSPKKSIIDIPDLLKANFKHSKNTDSINKLLQRKKSSKKFKKENNYEGKENGNIKNNRSSFKKKKNKYKDSNNEKNKKSGDKKSLKVRFQSNKDVIKELILDDDFKKIDSLKDLTLSQKKNSDNQQNTYYNKKYLNVSNGIILEESFIKNDNDSEESQNRDNNKSNNEIYKISFNMEPKSENRLSLTKFSGKSSRKSFHSTNELNVIQMPEESKIKVNSDEENDLNTDDLEDLYRIINQNNNELFYSKCKDFNIFEDAFNEKFYNIINSELDYFKNNINKFKLNNKEKVENVKNYIENGLLIPIIFYFKKAFTLVNSFTGKEMIKLYYLVQKCLSFKIHVYKFKNDIWRKSINEIDPEKNENINLFFDLSEIYNSQNYYFSNRRNASIIDSSYLFDNKRMSSTYESLAFIKSNKISMYDYSSLYQIMEKEFFILIKDRKLLNITKAFKDQNIEESLKKKKIREEEKILNLKKKYNSDLQKRLLRTYIIYKYNKISCYNENYSSLFSILPEISLGYETNYRHLLITLLVNYGKDNNIKNEFGEISYLLLFKLQCLQTMETQNELMNLLGGIDSEECGFLEDFSQILFYRVILLIIDFLNPADKLIQSNYFVSCNLIYIFKFLCIEHNYFFQFHIVKSLSYAYTPNNLPFFKFGINEEENTVNEDSHTRLIDLKVQEKYEIYNIKFYDFFLFLLTKIILISDWENCNSNNFHPNPFLFDLFSSILDLLIEIIQGSKPELLSILFDNIDEKIVDILGENFEAEKYKKNESFEVFIKNVVKILFEEKYDLNLINEIKNCLMHYFTSILEEKNCNETMKKFIKKYLNINNIYTHIIKILKLYFLNKQKPKNFEKIKYQINSLIPNKNKLYKAGGEPRVKRNSLISPISRPRMPTSPKSRKRKQKIYLESSSSNVALLNTIIDTNKDLRNQLLALNLQKDKHENAHFKNILANEGELSKYSLKEARTLKDEINNNNNSLALELQISKLTFGKKLYDFFRRQFYEDPNFVETLEFKLTNSFYKFIKIITLKKSIAQKAPSMKQIKKMSDINYEENEKKEKKEKTKSSKGSLINYNNLDFEKDIIEKYFIEKFFEKVTSTVEIRTNEGINKTIIYTRLPIMQLLSQSTRLEFYKNVNRDNETSKKNDLMKYIEYFIKEIKYYRKYNNKWDVWFSKINFYYLEITSYMIALVYNLLLLFTIRGDIRITGDYTLKERRQNKNKIINLIDYSINEWAFIYYIFNWIYLALNGIFILLWIRYKLPLYYREDKINFRETFKKDKSKKLNIFDKLYILIRMCIFGRNYIKMLIYEFLMCIVCLIIERSEILYPFLVIPVIFINRTLKNIIISIRLNFKQFCLTFCFAFIIIYVFSNLYFFFLNSDFEEVLNYYNDNYCKTLTFAFLNALDNGLRARGGLGDSGKRISFLKNGEHYVLRLILDDLFFLFIVIIMIDMVFGIVVKSFDALRYRNQKFHSDKINHCFICHSHRDSLEKMRKNFNEHIKRTHNLWNYVEYMILLKLKDIHDLNAINQYVRGKMERKDITWLPTYKDINKENDNDFEDKNLLVFHENANNYKIKNISGIFI